jgi:hypothetical protein
MTLDYTTRRQVKIEMLDFVDEIIAAFDKANPTGSGTKPSAAPENLFKVDEDCVKLRPKRAQEFHNIVSSTKQKLNTRSSTETEVVSVDDCIPAICWTRYFMDAQQYYIQENIVFQDNRSSMLLEKNGKASSSKRMKHINIRYFFITDRIKKGELTVEWCPSGDMTGDFMTKPTQGALFKSFRDQLMGVVSARDPGPGKTKKSKPTKKAKDKSVSKKRQKPSRGRKVKMVLPSHKAKQ